MIEKIDYLGKNCSSDFITKKIIGIKKRVIIDENKSSDKNKEILVVDILNKESLEKNFFGYIFKKSEIVLKDINKLLVEINYEEESFKDNDIILISILNKNISIKRIFRNDSNDNILFLTNKCNSNCIFCPDSDEIRKNEKEYIDENLELLDLYPTNIKHIGITGGEPTILKDSFFEILKKCKEKLPTTEFTIISNGRMFFYKDFSIKYNILRPLRCKIAIPLHGYNEETHDKITRVKGSFKQTFIGLKNLYELGERIEIRIVLNKKNFNYLDEIIKLIILHFPKVEEVNILSLELLGNAGKNYSEFWIDKKEINESLKKAVFLLVKEKIKINLYNFPLCFLNSEFWTLSQKSITDYKVKYDEKCNECIKKEMCGGFFYSTYNIIKPNIIPIK